MVLVLMLGLANVMKGFMVTIAQVNFQTCNWWFADQNLPTTLYYLLREQDRLTILKFFYHPEHTKSTLFA